MPFRQCPYCRLPHEAGLTRCPITSLPLFDTETRLPAVEDAGLVGAIVDDKYEVIETLGRGSTGHVYRARHVKIGRQVALKVLRSDLARAARVRDRFIREAQATGRVDHPNVVQIWDVGITPDGDPFMVMELLDGEPLSRRLVRERRLPLADALAVTQQVLSGLAAAHAADVIHRDVKPENVVLTRRDRVKLVDFGLARLVDGSDAARITGRGDIIGTPAYLSPEQGGGGTVGAPGDAWAATVVLYEMVVGELPFAAESVVEQLSAIMHAEPEKPSAKRPYLPAALDAIVEAGLRKDPAARASVDELLERLTMLEAQLSGAELRDTADELPASSGSTARRERGTSMDDTIEEASSVFDTIDDD
ncbi:MAG: serine/threonine protein kinase [Myxococcales bacterium]|nr:serine/threonine protein kinase [Myxococcales bacterium]